jgi:hypothetical protein
MSTETNMFENCMNALKEKIAGIEVNAETIISVLKFAMEIVETTTLKGKAQNEMVNKLVKQVVKEAPIADDKEKLLLDMIDNGILTQTIDLVVDASKGEVNVNSAAKVAVGCCWSIMSSKKK